MWEGQATLRYWTPPWPPGPRQFAETSKKCSNLTISHQLPPISSPISRPTRQFSHAPHFLLTLSLSQSYPFPGASCTLRREWCDLGVSKRCLGTKVSTKSWSVNDVICSPCLVTVTCPMSHFGDEPIWNIIGFPLIIPHSDMSMSTAFNLKSAWLPL